jgi:hypothetical protein
LIPFSFSIRFAAKDEKDFTFEKRLELYLERLDVGKR